MQEKNIGRGQMSQNALTNLPSNKTNSEFISEERNKDIKKHDDQKYKNFETNLENEFLKDYNRSGTLNDKFKKFHRKNYRKSADINCDKNTHNKITGFNFKKNNKNNYRSEKNSANSNLKGKQEKIQQKLNKLENKYNSKLEDNTKPGKKKNNISTEEVEELYSEINKASKLSNRYLSKYDDNSIINNYKLHLNSVNKEKNIHDKHLQKKNSIKKRIFSSIFPKSLSKNIQDKNYNEKSSINYSNRTIEVENKIENSNKKTINNIINKDKNQSKVKEKEMESNFIHSFQKGNNSIFSYKIKIRKSALKESIKENNQINNKSDLSLNYEKKDENKIIRKCKTGKKIISKFEIKNEMFLSPKSNTYKFSENKSEDKIGLTEHLSSKTDKLTSNEYLIYDNDNNLNINNNLNQKNPIKSNDINHNPKLRKTSKNVITVNEEYAVLNTYNRKILEYNNQIYINDPENDKKKKEDNDLKLIFSKITPFINQKRPTMDPFDNLQDNLRNKYINTNDLGNPNQVVKNVLKFRRNLSQPKIEDLSIIVNSKTDKNLKTKKNSNITEMWERRKYEIFQNLENKYFIKNNDSNNNIVDIRLNSNIKHEKNKNSIQKPSTSFPKNREKFLKLNKELYYSSKNYNLSKTQNEIPDLKVNIGLFIEENFDKKNSIFQTKFKKNVLETSEVSKEIFINSNKISNILDKKYNYLKNLRVDKYIEKSTNLIKK